MSDLDPSRLWGLLAYDPERPILFHSALFLFGIAILLGAALPLRRRPTARLLLLTTFSLFFFYKACGWYVLCILGAALLDFNLARWLEHLESRSARLLLLWTSVVANLGLLGLFKYTDFFLQIANETGAGPFRLLHLALPVGISFYTFENLSYTIDVYRREIRASDRFLDYLFFLSFFPKLMMGPIVRASDFLPQIRRDWELTREDVGTGAFLLLSGLCKKLLLSDPLWTGFVGGVFEDPASRTGIECLAAAWGYALVIYCDFSGYSDMAIGLARWLGIRLPPNFLSPYRSTSVTEFWRRWHISLSSWLRDYLYIPLGGNRKGRFRQGANLLATMVLGGFWHGASWNFLLWGAWHGLGLHLDKLRARLPLPSGRGWRLLGGVATFHFVCLGWVLFAAPDLPRAWTFLARVGGDFQLALLPDFVAGQPLLWGLLATGFALHLAPPVLAARARASFSDWPFPAKAAAVCLVVWLVLQLKALESMPPIYLRF